MKWFKHISDSLDDPFIFDLCQECGPAGYYVFFGVLEIYSREFKTKKDFKLRVTWKYLCSKLLATRKYMINKALLFCNENKKIIFQDDGKYVEIYIPKFRKLLDETTIKKLRLSEKKSGESPESNRNCTGVVPLKCATDIEVDKDLNNNTAFANAVDVFLLTKRKRKLKGKRLETFLKFWDAFDYKRGKREAADAWYDIPELKPSIVSQIIRSAKIEATMRTQLINSGKTPKMAQGWISGSRWEDDIYNEKSVVKSVDTDNLDGNTRYSD